MRSEKNFFDQKFRCGSKSVMTQMTQMTQMTLFLCHDTMTLSKTGAKISECWFLYFNFKCILSSGMRSRRTTGMQKSDRGGPKTKNVKDRSCLVDNNRELNSNK